MVDDPIQRGTQVNTTALAQFIIKPHARTRTRRCQALILKLGLVGVCRTSRAIRQGLVRLPNSILRGVDAAITDVKRDRQTTAEYFRISQGEVLPWFVPALVEGPHDGSKRAANAPLRRAVEACLRHHVDCAANRIAIHVRRRRFHHLHPFDDIRTERLKLEFARRTRRRGVRQAVTVHRDRGQILAKSAYAHITNRTVDRGTFDSGQTH